MKIFLSKKVKQTIRSGLSFLSFFGVYPLRSAQLRHLPRYIREGRSFRKLGGQIDKRKPIFVDYSDQAGAATGHYFHQDLLVASMIAKANPRRHIDVGSRIDGFVAHVAAFRKIEVLDVRQLNSTGHENIHFLQADLMDEKRAPPNCTDSLSCLHAIEHFGLGRYGDGLDPEGHLKGFANLVRMLEPGGNLYISFPIADSTQVHFNAHRVFHPRDILEWPATKSHLELLRFDYVDDKGNLQSDINLSNDIPSLSFGCGIYSFKKIANH